MRHEKRLTILLLAFAMALVAGCQQAEGRRGTGRQGAADAPASITLPVGTTISVRIADAVDSNHNHAGDLLTGIVDPSVFLGNHVVIPRGTEAHIRVMEDKKGGHLHGKAAVHLELVGLVINDEKLNIDSNDYKKQQGALSAKLKGTGTASAAGGASAATSATPEGGAVGPIIAIFRAAKIAMPAGTRVPFKLTTPFTFDQPVEAAAQP
jgi:hypothetical protein